MFILGRDQVRAESSTEAFKLLTGVVPLHYVCEDLQNLIKLDIYATILAARAL